MIIDLLLQFLLTLAQGIFGLLPAWEWPIPPEVALFVNWITGFNLFAPINELMAVTAVSATAFGAMIALKGVLKIVDWIADIIP